MQEQLPGRGKIFLDHVAHFVPALDAAAEALEACGFRLTPRAVQQNRVDGRFVPAGTANRCAMLRQGYVEILAAVGETPLARQLTERLEHHVGLHLAAFSSADAAAEHRRLAAAGFATEPLVDIIVRPRPIPAGPRRGLRSRVSLRGRCPKAASSC
jgi:hypothetical protein